MNKTMIKLFVLPVLAFDAQAQVDNAFFEDSHLEFNTQSLYLKSNYEDKANKLQNPIWHENIAQLLNLKYSSGYFNDIIGVDFNYYGIGKINATTNSSSGSSNNIFKDGEHSFNKLAYSLNLRPIHNLEINLGRIESNHPLLKSNDDALPALYQLAGATYDNGQFAVHGIFVDKANATNSREFEDLGRTIYETGKFEQIPIRIIGGEYYGDHYRFYTSYGNQEDISNYLLVSGQYYHIFTDDFYIDVGSKYRRKGAKAELAEQHIAMISGQINTVYTQST